MTDAPRHQDPPSVTGDGTDRGAPPGMPGWVKVSGIIVIVLVLLVVGLMFIVDRQGGHGPGQHGAWGQSAGLVEQALGGEATRCLAPSRGADR